MRVQKTEFSKTLLKQEATLIWILSISFIGLAFYCIYKGFTGSLPWLAAMVGFPWTAYGVSQACYYKKSLAENTCGGIKYEAVMCEAQKLASAYKNTSDFDYSAFMDGVDSSAGFMNYYNDSKTENPDDYQI